MRNSTRNQVVRLAFILVVCALGCRTKERSTPGGTPGVLRIKDSVCLPDVQVNLYRTQSGKASCIATAVSQLDGRFQLRSPDGASPFWLQPGEYAVTLESVGPVRLVWKQPVHRPETTPLKTRWTASESSIDLIVPEPQPMR